MEDAKKLVTYFTVFAEHFKPIQTLKTKIEGNQLKIIQIGRTGIPVGKLDTSTIDELSSFVGFKGITVSFNGGVINSRNDLEEAVSAVRDLNYSDASKINTIIHFEQCFILPLDNVTTLICLIDNLADFTNKLLNTLKIEMISRQQNKINIYSKTEKRYDSTVFNFINPSYYEKFEVIDEFVNNPLVQYYDLYIVPFAYPFEDKVSRYVSSLKMFELFADKKEQNKLSFIKKGVFLIDENSIQDSFGLNYTKLSELISFIYSDGKSVLIKLNVVKNLIYDYLSQSKDVNGMDIDFWQEVLEESKLEYKLYISDEITNFINDKKDVLKEQFELSYQIANKATQMRKNVTSNVVYILGIFLSNFLVESLKNNETTFNQLAFWLSLILSTFILISFYVNGEKNNHRSYVSKIKLINEHYPKLYIIKENIVQDLEKEISNPEIERLEKTEIFAEVVYWVIFLAALAGVIIMNLDALKILSFIKIIVSNYYILCNGASTALRFVIDVLLSIL